MSYVRAICAEIKNNKGMFLNWPVTNRIKLGDFGLADIRNGTFDWVGNLASYGVNLEVNSGSGREHELYRTSGKVDAKFDLARETPASVEIKFRCSSAISMEAFNMTSERLELGSVQSSLLAAIGSGKLSWHRDYVFVAQVQKCEAFTSLISGCKGASVQLTAGGAHRIKPFNTANPSIGVSASFDLECPVQMLRR